MRTKDMVVHLRIEADEDLTRVTAELDLDGQLLRAGSRARRNPADQAGPAVGEELAPGALRAGGPADGRRRPRRRPGHRERLTGRRHGAYSSTSETGRRATAGTGTP
jgi:Domain of unknown function (DUF1876)